MAPPIKVGIVGYGFSTKCFHLPFILPNPDFEVYAFLQRAAPPSDDDKDEKKPRWGHCTVDFPEAQHYQAPEPFFADAAIELVIILTHAHEEFIERALLAGKHGDSPVPCPARHPKGTNRPPRQSSWRSPSSTPAPKPTGSSPWPKKRA